MTIVTEGNTVTYSDLVTKFCNTEVSKEMSDWIFLGSKLHNYDNFIPMKLGRYVHIY
jgi:hypothetical protein